MIQDFINPVQITCTNIIEAVTVVLHQIGLFKSAADTTIHYFLFVVKWIERDWWWLWLLCSESHHPTPSPQSKIHAHNFTQHSFASKQFMSNAISINLHIKITIILQYWNYWWYKIIIANHHKMLYNYSQQWVMEEIKSINRGLQQNVLNLHLPVQMQVSLAVCQSVCVLSNPSPLFEPCIQAVNSS